MENNSSPVDIQKHLKGVEYPATKEELLEAAQNNSAPEEVVAALEELEDDAQFENVAEVSEALSEDHSEKEGKSGAGTPAETGEPEDTENEDDEDEDDDDEEDSEEESA